MTPDASPPAEIPTPTESHGRPEPPRLPVVDLSLVHQALIALLGLGIVIPLVRAAVSTSPHAADGDPLLGLVASVAIPLVTFTVIHLVRWPLLVAWLIFAAVPMAMADGMGPVSCLMLASLLGGLALTLGVRIGLREAPLFVAELTTVAAATVGLIMLSGWVQGFDGWARLEAIPPHVVDGLIDFVRTDVFGADGLTPSEREALTMLEERADLSAWLLPAHALTFHLFAVFIGLRLVRRRLPVLSERLPPFWSFGLDERFVWPLVAMGLLSVISTQVEWPLAQRFADNALLILYQLYWLAGLAIAHCLMLQFRLSSPARLWLWGLLVLLSMVSMLATMRILLAALGLFDTWFGFRRRGAQWAAKSRANRR